MLLQQFGAHFQKNELAAEKPGHELEHTNWLVEYSVSCSQAARVTP